MTIFRNILIPVENSRQSAANQCCDNDLHFPTREFLTLKGIQIALHWTELTSQCYGIDAFANAFIAFFWKIMRFFSDEILLLRMKSPFPV